MEGVSNNMKITGNINMQINIKIGFFSFNLFRRLFKAEMINIILYGYTARRSKIYDKNNKMVERYKWNYTL